MGKLLQFPTPEPERLACAECGWHFPIKMMFYLHILKAELISVGNEKVEIEQAFSWECPGCGEPFKVKTVLTEEDMRKKP